MTLRDHCTPDQLRAHAILDRVRAGTCRTDVLRKLIALEPITAGQIHAVCGWPAGDVDKALDELLRAGLVTFKHYGFHRWYVAK